MMKKSFFALVFSAVIVAGVVTLAAQAPDQQGENDHSAGPAHRRADPQRNVQMLGKRLNLTDDQKAKLLPILTDQQQQMRAIFNDSSLSTSDRREKMKTLRQDTESKVEALLTDEQKQKYAQLKQERMQRTKDRMGTQDGGDHRGTE
jgi:protein CpxP